MSTPVAPNRTRLPVALWLAAHAAGVAAQTPTGRPQPMEETSPWTVDDILTAEQAANFEFSPDGRYLVWTRSEVDREKGRRYSNLWITRLADLESWPLTRGKESVGSPRWSPDGRLVAFTWTREPEGKQEEAEGAQLWVIRIDGGEPWPLTTGLRGLRQFAWKGPRSDTLVLAAEERRAEHERARKKREDAGYAVEDTLESPPVRLWLLDVKGRALRRLTEQRDPIEAMAVSPDGRWALTRNTASLSYRFDARQPPRTFLVDLATGERREVRLGERIVPQQMEWAPDGRGVYFSYEHSSHPIYRTASITLLGYYDVAADRFVPVELGWDRGLARFESVPGGVVAFLEDGVRVRAARYERTARGWRRTLLEGEHAANTWTWSVSPDGRRIAYVMSRATTPPQPFVATLTGSRIEAPRRIVELNPQLARRPAVRAEVLRWAGARDEEVEGILYYPLDYRPGRPYPLVVSIHGGPASADRDAWSSGWSYPIVLWLQKGAFVLKPNYHGSCCYGLAFVESIGGGRYYELEVPDIERGVDDLVRRGLVHPDSIAAQGWSNGAILTTALTVANPGRYRAAIAGAGDVEWISDWGNVDFGAAFDNYYFGASPLEDPQRYIEKSPFFKLDRVRAPTLIFFGTEDRNVPPSQGWSHFRALQQLGRTEVRFVLFPGEPHGLQRLAHQRRKVEEELRWLDRHLWGRADTPAVLALRDDAPLAGLLALARVARDGRLLGVRQRGVLVPETVRRGALEVGRFEVTRAQWREFDPSYAVEPGTENHPVTGVRFEQAQAYARWLAERTGRPFRLPTRAELEALGGGKGNTLDYWAGYPPNPEDARRLAELVRRLPGPAPLLREAGSFPADRSGDPPVYDLGGNAAEWAVGPDGRGVAVGPSADRPADPAGAPEPDPAYRGFRVVVDVAPAAGTAAGEGAVGAATARARPVSAGRPAGR